MSGCQTEFLLATLHYKIFIIKFLFKSNRFWKRRGDKYVEKPAQNPSITICCYRPQTKFAKVMFSQVSVCLQGGICLWSWGVSSTQPWSDTPPGQTHPHGQTPPGHTPSGQTPPSRTPCGETSPWADTSPLGSHPLPSACWDTPPPSACWDMVNKRVERIPLECILVLSNGFPLFFSIFYLMAM